MAAAHVEVTSNPSHLTSGSKEMKENVEGMVEGGIGTLQFVSSDQIAEEETPYASAMGSPVSAKSIDTQIKETTEKKWKHITCGLTLFTISLAVFTLYFTHFHTLTNLLILLICWFVFSAIFGVLSFMVFQKITEEERLKWGKEQIASCSVQRCLFFLFVFLTATVYVLVAINAISKYICAQKP